MQRTIITLALIAGLTGPACAQVGRADLLALDDEALVSAYLAAVFRDAGDDEALARKLDSQARQARSARTGGHHGMLARAGSGRLIRHRQKWRCWPSPGLHRRKWRCCSSSSPETASLQLRGIVGCGDARGEKKPPRGARR